MPPTQKKPVIEERKSLLQIGTIVNIEKGGRTITGLEVLDYDEHFVKLRWNAQLSPMTEIVLIPWGECVIGLTGER